MLPLLLANALAVDAAETKFLWARITDASVSTADPITLSAELAPIQTPVGAKAVDEWLNGFFDLRANRAGRRTTLRYTVSLYHVGEPWGFGLLRTSDQQRCNATFENWVERLSVIDALNTGAEFRIHLGSVDSTRVLSNLAEIRRSMMRLEDAPIPNCKLRMGEDGKYYARIRVERYSANIGVGFEAKVDTPQANIVVGESPNPAVKILGVPTDVTRSETFRLEAELSSTKRAGAATFTMATSPDSE